MKIWPFDPFSERSWGQRIAVSEVEQRLGRILEFYQIIFIEDPLAATNINEIKAFSQRTTIPVIGSELFMTRWQIREWLEKHTSQILMTVPVWNGGIAETRKMANMAEAFGNADNTPQRGRDVLSRGVLCIWQRLSRTCSTSNSVRAFYKNLLPDHCRQRTAGRGRPFRAAPKRWSGSKRLRPAMRERDDLARVVSGGDGLAVGRRAMGDHWERELIR